MFNNIKKPKFYIISSFFLLFIISSCVTNTKINKNYKEKDLVVYMYGYSKVPLLLMLIKNRKNRYNLYQVEEYPHYFYAKYMHFNHLDDKFIVVKANYEIRELTEEEKKYLNLPIKIDLNSSLNDNDLNNLKKELSSFDFEYKRNYRVKLLEYDGKNNMNTKVYYDGIDLCPESDSLNLIVEPISIHVQEKPNWMSDEKEK